MSSRGRLPAWTAPVFCAVLGSAFLGVAIAGCVETISRGRGTEETEGVVVENLAESGRRTTYRPVVEFTARDRIIRIQGHTGSRPASYDIGDRVTVLYKPERPEEAVIDSFEERFLLPAVFGGLGLIALVAGFGVWRAMRR